MSMLVNKMFLDSMFPSALFPKDDILDTTFGNSAFTRERSYKTDTGYKIFVPLAGVAKEDISVKVLNNRVEIKAVRKFEDSPVAEYHRSYDLGEHLDGNSITSKYNNGLLLIDVPLKKAKDVSIDVKVQ